MRHDQTAKGDTWPKGSLCTISQASQPLYKGQCFQRVMFARYPLSFIIELLQNNCQVIASKPLILVQSQYLLGFLVIACINKSLGCVRR